MASDLGTGILGVAEARAGAPIAVSEGPGTSGSAREHPADRPDQDLGQERLLDEAGDSICL
ncbi:MAG TPA: hypothetical protein PLY56_16445, partial [Armatimonadota bacterium]|nr:hypothetical protein [Armatimonadota bacterium]